MMLHSIRNILRPIKRKALCRLAATASSLSQTGQDAWVFREAFNGATGGYFVDVGAHDGVQLSNTFLLERRYGWRGLLIEANPRSFALCAEARQQPCLNICLDETEGEVDFAPGGMLGGIIGSDTDNKADHPYHKTIRLRTRPLKEVLDECGAPETIDYLSIDVEGAEDRVLGTFDYDAYQFNCMTIERPSDMLRKRLSAAGYIVVKEAPGFDAYFIHSSFRDAYVRNLFAFYESQSKSRLARFRRGH